MPLTESFVTSTRRGEDLSLSVLVVLNLTRKHQEAPEFAFLLRALLSAHYNICASDKQKPHGNKQRAIKLDAQAMGILGETLFPGPSLRDLIAPFTGEALIGDPELIGILYRLSGKGKKQGFGEDGPVNKFNRERKSGEQEIKFSRTAVPEVIAIQLSNNRQVMFYEGGSSDNKSFGKLSIDERVLSPVRGVANESRPQCVSLKILDAIVDKVRPRFIFSKDGHFVDCHSVEDKRKKLKTFEGKDHPFEFIRRLVAPEAGQEPQFNSPAHYELMLDLAINGFYHPTAELANRILDAFCPEPGAYLESFAALLCHFMEKEVFENPAFPIDLESELSRRAGSYLRYRSLPELTDDEKFSVVLRDLFHQSLGKARVARILNEGPQFTINHLISSALVLVNLTRVDFACCAEVTIAILDRFVLSSRPSLPTADVKRLMGLFADVPEETSAFVEKLLAGYEAAWQKSVASSRK